MERITEMSTTRIETDVKRLVNHPDVLWVTLEKGKKFRCFAAMEDIGVVGFSGHMGNAVREALEKVYKQVAKRKALNARLKRFR